MAHYYDNFLAAITARFGSKAELANALLDLLHIEKESVYRRLRKDVYFSAEEVMRIAGAWNISLDNLVSADPGKTRPFHFKMIEYADPTEADYRMLERFNTDLQEVGGDHRGRMYEVLNSLPRGLYGRSEPLTRFFTMKWLYKFGAPDGVRGFGDIRVPERMRKLDSEYVRLVHSIPEVHSIHDGRLFDNVVDEIAYFRSIGMLAADDIALLRDELIMLVDYVENVTTRGAFPTTGNKLYFYLSHRWIDTQMTLCESQTASLSMIEILERNTVASEDRVVMERLKNMVRSMKRSSVLLSESNALLQTEYFARQRSVVLSL